LIVAAAAGVQLAAHIPQAVDECLLNVHVDVFELCFELEFTRVDLGSDRFQGLTNLLAFLRVNQANECQHLGMSDRALNVMGEKAVVEADAFGEPLDAAIRRLVKNSATGGTGQQNDPCLRAPPPPGGDPKCYKRIATTPLW
jgi:hypothetical protein